LDNGTGVTQEINANDGQVAGRDIINNYSDNYWSWSSDDLIDEWEACRHKLRSAQRKILLAPNMLMFFCVVFFLIMTVITGKLSNAPAGQLLGFAFIALVALVMFPKANKKYGRLITLQKDRIEDIELVLLDRGIEL
jgi:hypothetical protein